MDFPKKFNKIPISLNLKKDAELERNRDFRTRIDYTRERNKDFRERIEDLRKRLEKIGTDLPIMENTFTQVAKVTQWEWIAPPYIAEPQGENRLSMIKYFCEYPPSGNRKNIQAILKPSKQL